MIDQILEESFYKLEREVDPEYFDDPELVAYVKRNLPEKQYAEFEAMMNHFAGEVSFYWYRKGFHAAQRLLKEMLLGDEK